MRLSIDGTTYTVGIKHDIYLLVWACCPVFSDNLETLLVALVRVLNLKRPIDGSIAFEANMEWGLTPAIILKL
jgi:hypothetical protein